MKSEQKVLIRVPDGVELEGLLCVQDGPTGLKPVIVCHPHPAYGGNMYNNVVEAVVGELIGCGATTLRFNYRSTGKPALASEQAEGFPGEVQDLLAAIAFLQGQLESDRVPVSVAGYSFGSYIALKAAKVCADVKAVYGIAPPVSSMAMGGVGRIETPKYFTHGLRDTYGPPEAFSAWYSGLPNPKEATSLDADHFYVGVEGVLAAQVADKLLG